MTFRRPVRENKHLTATKIKKGLISSDISSFLGPDEKWLPLKHRKRSTLFEFLRSNVF